MTSRRSRPSVCSCYRLQSRPRVLDHGGAEVDLHRVHVVRGAAPEVVTGSGTKGLRAPGPAPPPPHLAPEASVPAAEPGRRVPVTSGPVVEPGRRTISEPPVRTRRKDRRARRVSGTAPRRRSAGPGAPVGAAGPGKPPAGRWGGKPPSRPRRSGTSLRSDRSSVHHQRDGDVEQHNHNKADTEPETRTHRCFRSHSLQRQPAAKTAHPLYFLSFHVFILSQLYLNRRYIFKQHHVNNNINNNITKAKLWSIKTTQNN